MSEKYKIKPDGSCQYCHVDFYKPTGKWYAGGVVDMEDVRPWSGQEEKMDMLQKNQNILVKPIGRYYTIVLDDLDSLRGLEEYKTLWKRVLQIGRDE